jgi:hypothetical protein
MDCYFAATSIRPLTTVTGCKPGAFVFGIMRMTVPLGVGDHGRVYWT